MIDAPIIETERLLLRAPKRADFDSYAATLMSDRARYIGGPFTLEGAWADFSKDVAGWVLNGFGLWAIESRETGEFLGVVGPQQPPYFPETEFGWVLVEAAEGKGVAYEAALAARAFCYERFGFTTLVSHIDVPNQRSIRLAERLGAIRDDAAPRPAVSLSDPSFLIYRHPSPGGFGPVAGGV